MRSRSLAAALCGAIVLLTACADDGPTDADRSPLAGLERAASVDSGGNAPPPATDLEEGYFRGRVVGESEPGAGNDSLDTAPRIGGVHVNVYPRIDGNDADPALGPVVATAITDVLGEFRLPPVPGGAYVVTFTPAPASGYSGVWVSTIAHSGSHEHPWWVVLPK